MKPKFQYACLTCNGPVTKEPCHTEKDKDGNVKDYAGLHGWKCDKCGDGVKVKRTERSIS